MTLTTGDNYDFVTGCGCRPGECPHPPSTNHTDLVRAASEEVALRACSWLSFTRRGKAVKTEDELAAIISRHLEGEQGSLKIDDYEDVLNGYRKLVRELDVIWNGEEGAAKQASLCDMVAQIENELPELRRAKHLASKTHFLTCGARIEALEHQLATRFAAGVAACVQKIKAMRDEWQQSHSMTELAKAAGAGEITSELESITDSAASPVAAQPVCDFCDHPTGFFPAAPEFGKFIHRGRDNEAEPCTAPERKCPECDETKTSPECWSCEFTEVSVAAQQEVNSSEGD